MRSLLFACVLLISAAVSAQTTGDVLGAHDLGASTSTVKGQLTSACTYCHAPQSGITTGPLWSQTLSSQPYTLYTSDTLRNTPVQPPLGADSTLCLSCHDGTIAPGQTVPYGKLPVTGTMTDVLGTKLQASHPFSLQLPLKDAANLVQSLAQTQTTADITKSVQLIKGNVECTTCHNAHAQNIDKRSPNFLARDNGNGGLCLSCHETKPRTVDGRDNALVQWTTSVHATSGAQVSSSAGLGGYNTVAEFACLSCHVSHNAAAAAGLLRNPVPAVVNIDTTSQSCITCHNGSDKLLSPILNVFGEFEKKGHPFPVGSNTHTVGEAVVLDQNRHTTCADCHNAHAAMPVTSFGTPPDLRPSQTGVAGVALDGSSLTGPASRQYENCLRCHGNSTGKQALSVYGYLPQRAPFAGDPLNVIAQFTTTAVSFHPVMRDATLASQPSLRPSMLDLSGKNPSRVMGTRIFCTDCHNSDNNREFGGTGPNGPHGSNNWHILERRYEFSQVGTGPTGGPGTPITNLFLDARLEPDSGGPYSLCAKCHDLNSVNRNDSFAEHSTHIQKGFSCSVCHSAHGVPAGSAGLTGMRLVNFDLKVVAPNAGVISYSGGSCVLICHGEAHNGH